MHFISETWYNAATEQNQSYYHIKESFRDALGKERSRIMLNVGFMEKPLDPYDVAAIGRALSRRFDNGGQQMLPGKDTDGLKPLGEKIRIRQCSEPTADAAEIYRKLGYKDCPFTRRRIIEPPTEKSADTLPKKFVVHKLKFQKRHPHHLNHLHPNDVKVGLCGIPFLAKWIIKIRYFHGCI